MEARLFDELNTIIETAYTWRASYSRTVGFSFKFPDIKIVVKYLSVEQMAFEIAVLGIQERMQASFSLRIHWQHFLHHISIMYFIPIYRNTTSYLENNSIVYAVDHRLLYSLFTTGLYVSIYLYSSMTSLTTLSFPLVHF